MFIISFNDEKFAKKYGKHSYNGRRKKLIKEKACKTLIRKEAVILAKERCNTDAWNDKHKDICKKAVEQAFKQDITNLKAKQKN